MGVRVRQGTCGAAFGLLRVRGARLGALLTLLTAAPAGGQALAPDPAGITPAAAARVAALLEPEIRRAMLEGQIPSVTVALVAGDQVVWTGAQGHANLWARTPATVETVYLIGSTFKAQSSAALLQLMEEGHFRLDDPVRNHLDGISIRGEDPARPVTFRHLLTHTSGLPVTFGGHPVWGETVPPPLERYLADSLRVLSAPLDSVRYSNIAYTLVAHLVERMAGRPYVEVIRERIWEPLEMRSTAFIPTPEMEERLSVPYVPHPETRRPVPAVRVKANVWPAGIVYGTIRDQAHWLIANLNGGEFRGRRILQPATVDSTHTLQFPRFSAPMAGGWGYEEPGYGLTWWVTHRNGERFFAHSGSVAGYTAFVMGNRDRRLGVAFLTNGHQAHPHLVRLSNLALDLLAEEQERGGE